MREDISDVLGSWPYDPEESVRRISGEDGSEKIQIRLPLGVEQYELDGRPDGLRQNGCESFLEYHKKRLDKYVGKHGSDEGFKVSHEECAELIDEGVLYYQRYVLLFQIGDYERTVRDTDRNIVLFDFVNEYAEEESDREAVEQYRPYILRMRYSASALSKAMRKRYNDALGDLNVAVRRIEHLPEVENRTFKFERRRSLSILRGMIREMRRKKPLTKEEALERRLKDAVRKERYEEAARLRDELTQLRKIGPPGGEEEAEGSR